MTFFNTFRYQKFFLKAVSKSHFLEQLSKTTSKQHLIIIFLLNLLFLFLE